MSKKTHNSTAFDSQQDKGTEAKRKQRKTQRQIVFLEFLRMPQTMKQVSVRTGIMRENICRIVAALREANAIESFSVGTCPITRHPKVNRWTTDPEKFKPSTQLRLSFQ
jgi:hypothetical protein